MMAPFGVEVGRSSLFGTPLATRGRPRPLRSDPGCGLDKATGIGYDAVERAKSLPRRQARREETTGEHAAQADRGGTAWQSTGQARR
jgi:hypothetical protein